MLKKSDILNIFAVGLKLFLITAVSAAILAVVNYITEPIIAKNNLKKQNDSMKMVLSDAVSFEKADMSPLATVELACCVTDVYEGIDANGENIGYAVMVSSGGYGGDVSLSVGVDNELNITGVDVVSHSETPGLGAKCTTDSFKNQFVGKTLGVEAVKNGASDNEIDAITSATITSKAVTKGVNSALTAVKIIKEAE